MERKHTGFDPAPAGGFRMENGRPQIVPGGVKHTPWPWIVEAADNSGERFNIYSDDPDRDGAYVAAVWSDESATGNDGADDGTPQYVTDEEAAANAHVITSVQDMYEALCTARDALRSAYHDGTPELRNAYTVVVFALACIDGRG